MGIQRWIVEQLHKRFNFDQVDFGTKTPYAVKTIGDYGVEITRPGKSPAVAYCVEPDNFNSFTVQMFQDAIDTLPQTGMLIVTRRAIDPDVLDYARHVDVCVETFGGFVNAIYSLDDISQYVDPEEVYVRRRLRGTRAVTSIARRGLRALELQRIKNLRPLMIVFNNRYELTDDEFAEMLNRYPKLIIDALVITNPNTQGFGDRVVQTARHANVRLYTFNEFIAMIRNPWT
ncbi:hypothetical protein KIPE111705_31870 [Kibdelosporangium persicum]|uniref:hypothetical protein n=1 Tax=Kibdelosporangium persicum TaxID=2698649 RepID=UPI0015663780|nr:hypothetical protein [Kibdelosporangium persicum]